MGEVVKKEEGRTSAVPLVAGGKIAGIIPTSIEEVWRVAQWVHSSGLAPRELNTVEKVSIAIMTGLEIGLPPMQSIQRIAVINGRPCLWGDAVPALLWARGFQLQERFEDGTAYCTVVRPDGTAITRSFSTQEAKDAGLLAKPGPWKQYPNRMLQMRARGFATKDGAADALSGLYLAEETIDITPADEGVARKSSAQAKRDGTTEVFNDIMAKVEGASSVEVLDQIPDLYADEIGQMPRRWSGLIEDAYEVRRAHLLAEGTQEAAE